jgi:tRNA-dihydrouridine synthase 4
VLLSGDVFDVNSLPFKPFHSSAPTDPEAGLKTLTLNDILPRDSEAASATGPNSLLPAPSNTNLSGFMSARGLLANPALFAGYSSCPWETVETFMCNVARCPLPIKLTLHHLQEMCGPGMGSDKKALLSKKERARLLECRDMVEVIDYLDEKIEEHTGQIGGLRRDL